MSGAPICVSIYVCDEAEAVKMGGLTHTVMLCMYTVCECVVVASSSFIFFCFF